MKNHKLFCQSSYDRYIDIFMKLWPRIKEKFPDATFDLAYGWDLFDNGYANNPERMAWKERMNKLMDTPGITNHGRVGQSKLHEIRSQCGIWSYPGYFPETNCIGALECQHDGLVPVTMNLAALGEMVKSGSIVDGDIYDEDVQNKWLEELFKYMSDEKLWEKERKKGIVWASQFGWTTIAGKWQELFT